MMQKNDYQLLKKPEKKLKNASIIEIVIASATVAITTATVATINAAL